MSAQATKASGAIVTIILIAAVIVGIAWSVFGSNTPNEAQARQHLEARLSELSNKPIRVVALTKTNGRYVVVQGNKRYAMSYEATIEMPEGLSKNDCKDYKGCPLSEEQLQACRAGDWDGCGGWESFGIMSSHMACSSGVFEQSVARESYCVQYFFERGKRRKPYPAGTTNQYSGVIYFSNSERGWLSGLRP